jgi:molecular chaperone DnaJ
MAKDYYEILGVSRNASADEIKKAFHRLAHQHHPHKGGDEKKFKEINEAYQILSNREKREQYDRFGQVFEGGTPGGAGANGDWDFSWAWGGPSGQSNQDFEFEFGDLGDIFGDIFGFGGARKTQKKNIKNGKDIKIDIEVSLEEVSAGVDKEITIYKTIFCSRCQGSGAEPGTSVEQCFSCRGTGEVQQIKKTFLGSFTQWAICPECGGEGHKPKKPCNVCKGEGRVKGEEKIRVNIPAGVDTNQIIKIIGKGEAGRRGGKAGNLYIRVFVKEHPVFERKGDDLYASVPISFSQAVLGDEIEVDTLEKTKILLKVPAGTESGKVLRISGKGITHFSGYGRGNLFVELIIKTPKKLSRRQKELLEELKKEGI